jgi:hypothetical protein
MGLIVLDGINSAGWDWLTALVGSVPERWVKL